MDAEEGKRRSLLPREHGAYAELALPISAALAASRPTMASGCLALAACATFLAHEPALIVLGRRGARARREAAPRSGRWLASALASAIVLAGAGLALSPPARAWTALPGALVACAAVLLLRRRERTVEGELVACAALTSAAVPTAIAGSVRWPDAVALWTVFYLTFALATVEVRSIARRDASRVTRLAAWSAVPGVAAVLVVTRPLVALALLPGVVTALVTVIWRPNAARLRRLGWILATSSLATAVLVVVALRVRQCHEPTKPESTGAAHRVPDTPPSRARSAISWRCGPHATRWCRANCTSSVATMRFSI